MLLCYVFAKAEKGNNPAVTKLASTFLTQQAGRLPTKEPVCATLEGVNGRVAEYQFFLRFKYASLVHVAMTVLQGRKHFREHLDNTLTMLEYPLYSEDDDAILRASALAHSSTAGIILLKSKLGPEGIRDKNAVLGCCNIRNMTCVDVLGPYDFVVEFPASSPSDVSAMLRRLESGLGTSISSAAPLFCHVFHPNTVSVPGAEMSAGDCWRAGFVKGLKVLPAITVGAAVIIRLFRRRD